MSRQDSASSEEDQRRLAAIVFTDFVGYTALTQTNEAHALVVLEQHNRLLRPLFKKHHGKEIKTIGDSFLVEFGSAFDATLCAIKIQEAINEHNLSALGDSRFQLRIGIHLGDVVHRGGDVFGDAVNIASRIEPLSDPGGVCISEQVFSQVRNKIDYPLKLLEKSELRNVKFPVIVYSVQLPWETVSRAVPNSTEIDTSHRIAVLPFVNMSATPLEDEYFADGLTDELISELTKLHGIRVIARTSVMHYKNTNKGISEIAKELRVGFVLEGSVRKSGNKIRITAQLIDSTSEDHLWTDRYDRELNDIFEVQGDIAKNVAKALESKLVIPGHHHEKLVSAARSTDNIGAYTLYLKGRFFWNNRGRESVQRALNFFQEAIKMDPHFARAYSGISDCYSIFANRGYISVKEANSRGKEACAKALELDDNLAEAHASLGLIYLQEFDYAKAESEFKRTIELNPSYASAHQWYSQLFGSLGNLEEMGREIQRAEEADPLSAIILANLAELYAIRGDYDTAIKKVSKAIEIEKGAAFLYAHRASFFFLKSMKEQALQDLRTYDSLESPSLSKEAQLAYLYSTIGIIDRVGPVLEKMLKASEGEYVPAAYIALLYYALDDMDHTFEWALKAAEDRSISANGLRYDPDFEKMRRDPRYKDLLKAFKLES